MKEVVEKYRKYIIIASSLLVVIGLSVIALVVLMKPTNTSGVADSIIHESAFSIFYPAQNTNGVAPHSASANYSKQSDGFSYVVSVNNKAVYISEQSTPDVFSQNGVYDYKLNQAHEYNSFQTAAGEVALTKPTELNNQTLAWVNSKGTLMLARATSPLSETEWKLLFNNMTIIN